MLEAALWGLAGGSSLLLGAAIGLARPLPPKLVGTIMGFGAGTLISALAFELTEEAFTLGGADAVAGGLAAGALAYFAGNEALHRRHRAASDRMSPTGDQAEASGSALLLGAVLDGIPESAVVGMSLLAGGGVAVPVLAAVFISNLPEALGAASGRARAEHNGRNVLGAWGAVTLGCGVSAALGYALLDGASGDAIGLVQAFAGGAVLTMLVETMIPEALDQGGRVVGLTTVLGFACAYLLSTLG